MSNRAKLALLFCLLSLVAVPFLGAESISPFSLNDAESSFIFFQLRLPRMAVALFTGGVLAILGACYQILFRNPLAEPYVLGVSNAVTLGFALAEILFLAPSNGPLGIGLGFVCALGVAILLMLACLTPVGESVEKIVLFGMGLQFVLSSALFLILSYHSEKIGGGNLRWFFGQIPWLAPSQAILFIGIGLPIVIGMLVFGRQLDALSLGDSVAKSMGFSPVLTRNIILMVSSVLVAWVVSFSGAIGFVGLVVPHVVRLIFAPNSSRSLLLWSFLTGAVFVAHADLISRILAPPFEFPIGIITTLVGGPLFLLLLWRRP